MGKRRAKNLRGGKLPRPRDTQYSTQPYQSQYQSPYQSPYQPSQPPAPATQQTKSSSVLSSLVTTTTAVAGGNLLARTLLGNDEQSARCKDVSHDFLQCVEENPNRLSACQSILDKLNACRRANGLLGTFHADEDDDDDDDY